MRMYKNCGSPALSIACFLLTTFLMCASAASADESANQSANAQNSTKTIAIIGNSELPKVEMVLPWRIASDKDPTKIELDTHAMPDALAPTDVQKHQERVYFDRYIKVPTDSFTNR